MTFEGGGSASEGGTARASGEGAPRNEGEEEKRERENMHQFACEQASKAGDGKVRRGEVLKAVVSSLRDKQELKAMYPGTTTFGDTIAFTEEKLA